MAGPNRSNTPAVVVLVAIVGLLATIGASALGGYWANRSVERQFESERSAAIQDQRREVYVDYLTATLRECDAFEQGDVGGFREAGVDVLRQQGRVLLIAGDPDLTRAVDDFTDALIVTAGDPPACVSNKVYLQYRDAFIEAAKPDFE